MALVHLNLNSKYLSGNTDVNIILPDLPRDEEPKVFYGAKKKYPVLWLLHGTFGDYTDWLRKTNIELYAEEKNLIVVNGENEKLILSARGIEGVGLVETSNIAVYDLLHFDNLIVSKEDIKTIEEALQ